ncbi:type II secretion system F family protein [Hydrogenophaga sp.]|uniref:type II secretion system F family protein n=1 Tax=Hydrogenophaga sp. TaxID=1904254 RepID=UPI002605D36D|nr:type II secretion system F family protein [Hydrogenophaga sp.]MDM7948592.1 type II secretion system F family protein [Hydrogenophaga sp.]
MRYRVKFMQGDLSLASATVEAASEAQAREQASALGHAVVAVVREGNWRAGLGQRKHGFPVVLFCQELLALLSSGVSIVEALETLAQKEARVAIRETLQGVLTQLREGRTLSSALQSRPDVFPPLLVATVKASERTSNLGEALQRYVTYANQLQGIRNKLVSAAIYPAMLIGVSSLVILFLMGYVVPRFSHIYEDMGDQLPLASQIMLRWGQWVEDNGFLLLGLAVAVLLALALGGGRRIAGVLARALWRVPSMGERMRVFQLARLYRTLGMLLRGGVPIATALEMVSGLLSAALQSRLAAASRAVREGQAISQAFEAHGLSTAVSSRMLRVAERAGNMGEMMDRAAAFHDEEMARWADWLTRLLGPALMLIMGLVIGAIVVLMYLPIFQLAESIQ